MSRSPWLARRTPESCARGFDDSVDDLVLFAVILKADVELVTTHEANPQHYL